MPILFWKLDENGNENKILDNGRYKTIKKSIDIRSKDPDLKSDPDMKYHMKNIEKHL